MHTSRLGLGLAVCLLASGCATRANVDFDPNASFERYHTFAWLGSEAEMREAAGGEIDPLLLRRIREAIQDGLVAKGYQKVDDREDADFVVSFQVASREKLQPQSQVRVGVGSWGSHGGWSVSAPVATQSQTEGTLSIDIFDGKSHEAVWHGSASRRVTPSMDRAALVNDVVGAILAKFPPQR